MALGNMATFVYNVRDELISGQNKFFAYVDIGNRTTAEGKSYIANALNQYTAIDDFTPQYDADGNQTRIQTSTGVWHVEYNAENRPVRWTQGDTLITMAFDALGRRTHYTDSTVMTQFIYKDYLCIQHLKDNVVMKTFLWDPTEPIATRPLMMKLPTLGANLFYMHDGNKNVTDVIYWAVSNGIAAHYDYDVVGAVSRTAYNTRVTNRDIIHLNPYRFSSEVHDDTLALVYYNYRHYNPMDGAEL